MPKKESPGEGLTWEPNYACKDCGAAITRQPYRADGLEAHYEFCYPCRQRRYPKMNPCLVCGVYTQNKPHFCDEHFIVWLSVDSHPEAKTAKFIEDMLRGQGFSTQRRITKVVEYIVSSGIGWPDIRAVRDDCEVDAEIKTCTGEPSPEQVKILWMQARQRPGWVHLWRGQKGVDQAARFLVGDLCDCRICVSLRKKGYETRTIAPWEQKEQK